MPGESDPDFSFGDTMSEALPSILNELEDGTPSPAPAPGPAPSPEPAPPAPAPGPAPGPAPSPTPEAHPFPKSWKKDLEQRWAALDPEVRAEVLRREENFHQGFQPYRQLAERVREALQPLAPFIQKGLDPFQTFAAFGTYHTALSNPQTAVEAVKSLLKDYNISLESLTAEAPYIHPEVAALQQQLEGVNSRLSEREQREQQAAQAALRSQIEAFAADPQNEHFEAVGGEMATLLKANPKLTLKEAYDKALRLNDDVWAKVQAKAQADRAAAEEAERKRKADEAAAALAASGGSVRSRARTAPATGAVGSMDDTMRETLAAIKNRDR